MNILTTNGLVGRYVTDWSGPGGMIRNVKIRLGAPNYPGDTMTFTGAVTATGGPEADGKRGLVEVTLPRRQQTGRPRDRHRDRCPSGGRSGVSAHNFSGKVAVAGIGATDFSKDSGRSELHLAVEAVDLALRDAGVEPKEVQGMVTYTADTNPDIDVARSLGMGDLTFFSRIHYGGGAALGVMLQAALAVSSGVADVVVVYRAFNERSGHRFGTGVQDRPPTVTAENAQFSWYSPQGLLTPASWAAMFARRYMHATGATSEALGWISVADRKHAANNPKAWFYEKPITMEDHQNSRFIVDPLRLLDCCQETDGGQAVVVTSLERARDLPNPPAVIASVAQGSGDGQDMMTSYYRDDMAHLRNGTGRPPALRERPPWAERHPNGCPL